MPTTLKQGAHNCPHSLLLTMSQQDLTSLHLIKPKTRQHHAAVIPAEQSVHQQAMHTTTMMEILLMAKGAHGLHTTFAI